MEIRDEHGILVASGFTDSEGKFDVLAEAVPGDYELVVSRDIDTEGKRIALPGPDHGATIVFSARSENSPLHPLKQTVSVTQLAISPKVRKHLLLAQQNFARMNTVASIAEIDSALQTSPFCAQAFAMRAFVRLSEKNSEAAIADGQRAISIDPSEVGGYIAMATGYNSLGDYESGVEAASQALRIDRDSWQARLELAKGLYGQQRFVLAIHALDLLRKDFPDVHLLRGNVLLKLGRLDESRDEFNKFVEGAPGDPRAPSVRLLATVQRTNSIPAAAAFFK